MRKLALLLTLLLPVACAAPMVEMGEWPAVAYSRTELERVPQGGHLIVIEQVPRFIAQGGDGRARPNADSSFDQYLFWDWCRGGGMAWQMVVVRPDAKVRSGWRYTKTVVTPGADGYGGETRITEGNIEGQIIRYADLRTAGLAFFPPTSFTCDRLTADWASGA
ncbi:MAG: hypothetical protein EP335_16835 [Alphaproteobacteria bacterium]|nr:MAG: hypothetical protein EP335_16835 [Alphaproteobacteria bacterium]